MGKIVQVAKHPNADKLRVCTVDIGDSKKQIVCGAPNVKLNMGVVVALPVTFIPGLDKKISVGKIRDVESHGMMCSERELMLSDEHEGIIEVDQKACIGERFVDQCDYLDAIIISVGGGGLIGGTASYLKSVWPDIEVIGCSPENSAVMIHSMAAGKILDLDSKPTLSDGTAGGVELDSITFPVCCDVIDDTIMVASSTAVPVVE